MDRTHLIPFLTLYGLGGGPARGSLKIGHFSRNRITERQSNIPIPLSSGMLISQN